MAQPIADRNATPQINRLVVSRISWCLSYFIAASFCIGIKRAAFSSDGRSMACPR